MTPLVSLHFLQVLNLQLSNWPPLYVDERSRSGITPVVEASSPRVLPTNMGCLLVFLVSSTHGLDLSPTCAVHSSNDWVLLLLNDVYVNYGVQCLLLSTSSMMFGVEIPLVDPYSQGQGKKLYRGRRPAMDAT